MKSAGIGQICLFNVQSDIDRQIASLAAERIYEKIGLAKPAKKQVQGYEMPLIPTQEDFFLFPFRHISATIVGGGSYKATDFSEGTVLKKSAPLLARKPAFLNHELVVGEEVGVVGETEYVSGYKLGEYQVPPGIEAPFIIDGKIYPDLVRKLSSPISPITSCSVTAIFEWEASHEFEHDGDFYWHLGEDVDGSMVRRIAKKILDYAESSMVWLGADPYAKMLDDAGKIINIDRANAFSRNKFSQDKDLSKYDSGRKFYVFDCLDNQKLLHLSNSSYKFSEPKTEPSLNMNEDLILFLAAFFGTTPELVKTGKFTKADAEKVITAEGFVKMKTNSENFDKVTTEKGELQTKLSKAEGEVVSLTADKKTLEDFKKDNEPKVLAYTNIIKSAKDEAKRSYNVFAKGKPEKTIEDEIEGEVSLDKLDAKIKMWGGQSVTEYGATCNKCQSKDISFRSSKPKEKGEEKEEEVDLGMGRLLHEI